MDTDDRSAGAGSGEEFVAMLTARLDAAAARPIQDADPEDVAAAVVGELRSTRAWGAPPSGLADAVMARVLAEAGTTAAAATAAPPVTSLDAHRSAREARARRLPRLLWAVPAAAAAAAVFAAGVLVTDRYVTGLRLGSETYQAAGTELAPGATAEVAIAETDSGFSIVLDPQQLPAAGDGSYYAAWLRDTDGQTVPIGSFHGRRGDGPVELWSGVDPAEYVALTVTLQSVDAPVLPSGPLVMRAELG